MYVGSYLAPVRELGLYSPSIDELVRLGFRTIGLNVPLTLYPHRISEEEQTQIAELVRENSLEIKLHPDLNQLCSLRSPTASPYGQSVQENDFVSISKRKGNRNTERDLLRYAETEFAPLVEWAKEINASSICFDTIRPKDSVLVEETVTVLRLLGQMTEGMELKFGVENSQKPRGCSPDDLRYIIEQVNHPRMGALIDIGHINTCLTMGRVSYSSPDEFIEAIDFPVWDTHFHNNDGSSDQHEPVRCGTLDIPLVVSAFAEIGYNGPLMFECTRKHRSFYEIGKILLKDREYLESLIENFMP